MGVELPYLISFLVHSTRISKICVSNAEHKAKSGVTARVNISRFPCEIALHALIEPLDSILF